MTRRRGAIAFWSCLFGAVLASRLCHANILWADEDYHLAAAIQVLHGKLPYRDFWYDKPPLNLLFYLLFGARTGIPLRVADSLFVLLCCALAFLLASRMRSRREGYFAAGALAFFLIFYLPPGILPLEPDTLMVAPELAAVYLAWRGKPLLSGLMSGIAFQLSAKGVFVLASAALFAPGGILWMLLGFLAPEALVLGWLAATGSARDYFEQVWRWGWLYAGSSGIAARADLLRVLDWLGFHAALLIPAVWYWMRGKSPDRWRIAGWCVISLIAAGAGLRFAPRYFNLLLPALAIPAAFGALRLPRAAWLFMMAALTIPAIRFGPRYVELAREDLGGVPHAWKDVAMDRESRALAGKILADAGPGSTIFIWGYRPDIVAYSRLAVAGKLWDSQPLTGVPADRHLSDSHPVAADWARENRMDLLRAPAPDFLADGLSRYNPALDIHRYPELTDWLKQYCLVEQTGGTDLYRRCAEMPKNR
ncbi:MAG TPA: hypothetical protein VFW83_03515 [Bryobacteraceae bacterium]|nr:hypothetical protein [Bryobacteraceae bacterium]